MSSIASPTTTTRPVAIFVNNSSRWSRVRRGSGVGMVKGAGSLQHSFHVESIRQREPSHPFGVARARHVTGVATEVHAAVSRYAPRAALPLGAQREAHRALHHAPQQ